MSEIIAVLNGLGDVLTRTQQRQMRQIILAMLCIPNRITMLGLSRWTGSGGSYRTLQRWYKRPHDWSSLLVAVVKRYLVHAGGEYILAVEDVVVSKVGKKTHGVGRFYSSIAQQVIPSVSFRVISLVDVAQRRAYPVAVEQQLPFTVKKQTQPVTKQGRGRPTGSKSHVKKHPT